MSSAAQTPLAELCVRRRGINDDMTLFEDRLVARWQRFSESGEATIPLNILSSHFRRSQRRGPNYAVATWFVVACLLLAVASALALPERYNMNLVVWFGVCGVVLGGFAIYDYRATYTQWTFMNAQHGTVVYVHQAKPTEVPAAEEFIDKLVQQIQRLGEKKAAEQQESSSPPE